VNSADRERSDKW